MHWFHLSKHKIIIMIIFSRLVSWVPFSKKFYPFIFQNIKCDWFYPNLSPNFSPHQQDFLCSKIRKDYSPLQRGRGHFLLPPWPWIMIIIIIFITPLIIITFNKNIVSIMSTTTKSNNNQNNNKNNNDNNNKNSNCREPAGKHT